jgi:hypothetical protein
MEQDSYFIMSQKKKKKKRKKKKKERHIGTRIEAKLGKKDHI